MGLRKHFRLSTPMAAIALALVGQATDAAGELITYQAPTGQSGTAEFVFRDATHLRITLSNTTGARLAGGSAVLTSVGMRLPDSAAFVRGGRVTVGVGSSSSGFSKGVLRSGDDVSAEWGATLKFEKDLRGAGKYDHISTIQAKRLKRFKGPNRDGGKALAGPQAGLHDSAAQGIGVISNSVSMLLTIDAKPGRRGIQGLSNAQQAAFLASLVRNSVLEFGIAAAFAYPVVPLSTSTVTGLAVSELTTASPSPPDRAVAGFIDESTFDALDALGDLAAIADLETLDAVEIAMAEMTGLGAFQGGGPEIFDSNGLDSLGPAELLGDTMGSMFDSNDLVSPVLDPNLSSPAIVDGSFGGSLSSSSVTSSLSENVDMLTEVGLGRIEPDVIGTNPLSDVLHATSQLTTGHATDLIGTSFSIDSDFRVNESSFSDPPQVLQTPEPSSLCLFGVGAVVLFGLRWRVSRQSRRQS